MAEPLNLDAALAELCIHLGDALVAANRIERALYDRDLLNLTEKHALKALRPEFVRLHWDVLALALSLAATTVAEAAENS